MRYDFWATVARVVVAISQFFGKKLTEEQAENLSRNTVVQTITYLLDCGNSIAYGFFASIWFVRTILGTTLLTFAKLVLPPDLKSVETEMPLEGSVMAPGVQATEHPVEVVGAIPDAFLGLETALEGEQAYEKDESKKRVRYVPVAEPMPGERYWYKRKKRYVHLVACSRRIAA